MPTGRPQEAFQLSEIVGTTLMYTCIFLGTLLIAFIRFYSLKERTTFDSMTGHMQTMTFSIDRCMIRAELVIQIMSSCYLRRYSLNRLGSNLFSYVYL